MAKDESAGPVESATLLAFSKRLRRRRDRLAAGLAAIALQRKGGRADDGAPPAGGKAKSAK